MWEESGRCEYTSLYYVEATEKGSVLRGDKFNLTSGEANLVQRNGNKQIINQSRLVVLSISEAVDPLVKIIQTNLNKSPVFFLCL